MRASINRARTCTYITVYGFTVVYKESSLFHIYSTVPFTDFEPSRLTLKRDTAHLLHATETVRVKSD